MNLFTADSPVLKIEGLETKFDRAIVSNSLVIALGGNYLAARILQQLHYCSHAGYGVVIEGVRWIYKPIREFVSEMLVGFTNWQIRKAIAFLVEIGVVRKEHLYHIHHGHNYAPKNRTLYYSLDYDQLEEIIREFLEKREKAETVESIRFVSHAKLICESFTEEICEPHKTNTKNTSTENNQRKNPSPSPLPCQKSESEFNLDDPWIDTEPPKGKTQPKEQEINLSPDTIEFNQKTKVPRDVVQDKLCKQQTTKIEQPRPPWRSPEEFNAFYRALVAALPVVANSHSPHGLAKVIIKDLETGKPHTYWDDWKNGNAIGTSDKPEWEASPGIPYPMFVEYLAEKCKQAHDSAEKAQEVAWGILSRPKEVKGYWGQFKRSVMNVSKQVAQDIKLGVSNPNTPVWMRERVEPTIEEALSAGENIKAIEQSVDISQIDMSSITKIMPKAEKEDTKPSIGSHINQMSVEKINKLLQNPIMRKHLTAQITKSDRFEVEFNELGQAIMIKLRKMNSE